MAVIYVHVVHSQTCLLKGRLKLDSDNSLTPAPQVPCHAYLTSRPVHIGKHRGSIKRALCVAGEDSENQSHQPDRPLVFAWGKVAG